VLAARPAGAQSLLRRFPRPFQRTRAPRPASLRGETTIDTQETKPPRRLAALLTTQFFGAFNDNAWKMLVIVLAGRAVVDLQGAELEAASQRDAMLAFVVITLPLMLFSLPAGALADRFSKRSIILAMKGLELLLMLAGTALLWLRPETSWLPLVVLGCMGLQSALFSPAKYGILPDLVPHERLSRANGALESWTFLAIIAGTWFGPQLVSLAGHEPWRAGAALSGLALVGLASAWAIPRVPPARAMSLGLKDTLRSARQAIVGDRTLWLAVVGTTFFWAVASLLGQDLLVYSRTVLHLPEAETGMPLGVFGLGVGLGSFIAGRLSENRVETGLIPLGALGLSLFTALLGGVAPGVSGTLLLMGLLGMSSGLLIVPLNALLQWRAPAEQRGAVIALANVFVFGGMLAGSVGGWFLAEAELSTRGIFLGAAAVTLAGTIWALRLLPQPLLRLLIYFVTHVIYRVRVVGLENVPRKGGVLLAPNHVSFVDALFLIATLDRRVRFLIEKQQFERPLLKPFLKLMEVIPISSTGGTRELLRALRDAGKSLDDGRVVCIFPEGQITRTGTLQPFRRGIERIARGRRSPIVPVHLDRVWGSIFSFSGGRFGWKLPKRIPYPVTISYGLPRPSDTPPETLRDAVAALGEQAWYARKPDRKVLHRPVVTSMRRRPWAFAMGDAQRPEVSRLAVVAGAAALARTLRGAWKESRLVGLLLPPGVPGAMANLAASLSGRASVNLNYTAGPEALASACRQASLKQVLTARAFVEKLGLQLPEGVTPLYLEDAVARIGRWRRATAALLALATPTSWLEAWCGAWRHFDVDQLATIIFSSGSTGEPKGVMLSHFNIDSNVDAVSQVFRPGREDRLLGILPLFHSFGFMSLWFALHNGVPVVFHANPLDSKEIGNIVRTREITLLLGTPTFLQLYTRRCDPNDFGSLRLVLAGAEKLSQKVAADFEDTFGIRPIEGYGATECSPVIATSVPSFRAPGFFQSGVRRGTVGLPLPGIVLRIVDPDTRESVEPGRPGLLLVRGPNVMRGYLGKEELSAQVLADGWYDTGDIASQDSDGFLRITDRLSRFSKIGGEMVPHGRVEDALHEAYGVAGRWFAVTAVPDERKGERLAVLTTVASDLVPRILEQLQAMGLPNLFIPRRDGFLHVEAIPLLGTGKTDLKAVRDLARQLLL